MMYSAVTHSYNSSLLAVFVVDIVRDIEADIEVDIEVADSDYRIWLYYFESLFDGAVDFDKMDKADLIGTETDKSSTVMMADDIEMGIGDSKELEIDSMAVEFDIVIVAD